MTPDTFDTIMGCRKPEKLWGAQSIAAYLNLSERTVRVWAKDPKVPIYQPRRGTYFAYRSELNAWLKTKAA